MEVQFGTGCLKSPLLFSKLFHQRVLQIIVPRSCAALACRFCLLLLLPLHGLQGLADLFNFSQEIIHTAKRRSVPPGRPLVAQLSRQELQKRPRFGPFHICEGFFGPVELKERLDHHQVRLRRRIRIPDPVGLPLQSPPDRLYKVDRLPVRPASPVQITRMLLQEVP